MSLKQCVYNISDMQKCYYTSNDEMWNIELQNSDQTSECTGNFISLCHDSLNQTFPPATIPKSLP